MRTMSAVVVVLALACAASCGDATSRESGDIYGSDRYTGRVSAQVLTPDGPRDPGKETGTGSAQFVPLGGGRSRLEVKANIRRENDSGFVVEGRETGDGWRGSSEALEVEIDRNGDISGGGIANHHRITFDGRATAQRIDLVVETEKMAVAAGESLPAGTRIVFDYDLERGASAATRSDTATTDAAPRSNAQGKSTQKKTCKRRVWKMRNVASPGGGMIMTQVPHCLD